MSGGGQFCLRWNNHQPNMVSVFSSLLQNDQLVDVTLLAENNEIHAHKIVLSACSPYFQVNIYPYKNTTILFLVQSEIVNEKKK